MAVRTACKHNCGLVFDSQNDARAHEKECPKRWDTIEKEITEQRNIGNHPIHPVNTQPLGDVAIIKHEGASMTNQTNNNIYKDVIKETNAGDSNPCDMCDRKFSTKQGLGLHRARVHNVYSQKESNVARRKAYYNNKSKKGKHQDVNPAAVVETEIKTKPIERIEIISTNPAPKSLTLRLGIDIPAGSKVIFICERCVTGYNMKGIEVTHCPACGYTLRKIPVKNIDMGE